MILTMSHWSSELPVCFPSQGSQVQIPWGDLCETGILLLALSRYIGDPDVIDHQQGFAPPTVTRPFCRQCDSPTWFHTAFLSRFHARCRSPFCFKTDGVGCWGGSPVESLQSHMILTVSHWSSGLPVCFPSQGTQVQIPWGDLCEIGILLLALARFWKMIFRGIPEFSKFFMLQRFWIILALKKCWANWPNTMGKRVNLFHHNLLLLLELSLCHINKLFNFKAPHFFRIHYPHTLNSSPFQPTHPPNRRRGNSCQLWRCGGVGGGKKDNRRLFKYKLWFLREIVLSSCSIIVIFSICTI